ncbi:unnamed protein product [Closterium sp. Naga37s-1]|nr:unnamed protein product [Closterium sp. Naga37s-1]
MASSSLSCLQQASACTAARLANLSSSRSCHVSSQRLSLPSLACSSTSASGGAVRVSAVKKQEELTEIRGMGTAEIEQAVVDLKGELFLLRAKQATRLEFKPSEFGRIHKRGVSGGGSGGRWAESGEWGIRGMGTAEIEQAVVDLKGELFLLRSKQATRLEFKPSEFGRIHKRVRSFRELSGGGNAGKENGEGRGDMGMRRGEWWNGGVGTGWKVCR